LESEIYSRPYYHCYCCLLTPLAQWITHTLITSDFFENILAYSIEQGLMTQEEAAGYFSLFGYIVQSVIETFGDGNHHICNRCLLYPHQAYLT